MKNLRQYWPGDDFIQLAVRLGLLALLVYWTFLLIRPFVPILAWSIVLAVALFPVFDLLARLLGGRPRLAAAILTLVGLGVVIGPATWLGLSALDGVRDFAENLSAGSLTVPTPPERVRNWPLVGPKLYDLWAQASGNLRSALREVAPHLKPLAGTMLALAGNAGIGTPKFLL
jgi:predicted PurR-regulated permease PerM